MFKSPWRSVQGRRQAHELAASASGISPHQEFLSYLINTKGASEVWPLVDAIGGIVPASVDSDRNGTYVGWTPQDSAGPISGTLAPRSHGSVDGSVILTSSFNSLFSGTIGSLFVCGKIYDAAARDDGTKDTLLYILGPGSINFIVLRKWEGTGANRGVLALTSWSGVGTSWFFATTDTLDWFTLGFSWDKTAGGGAGEGKFFFNGEQKSITQPFGVWGAGDLLKYSFACSQVPNIDVFNGWMAYFSYISGSIWTPTDYTDIQNKMVELG